MSTRRAPRVGSADEPVASTLLGEAVAAGDATVFVYDDEQLAYVAANEAASALTGFSVEELLALHVPDLVAAPEERLRKTAQAISAGSLDLNAFMLRTKSGDLVEVGCLSERTRLNSLEGFIVTICWPLTLKRSESTRRRAVELRDEARALRAQASVQQARARRIEQARASRTDTRPRLIFFYSETSGDSRRSEAFLAQILQRRRNHNSFKIVRVCTERRPELAERFHVERIPTFIVVADGRVRARVEAPKGRAPIQEALAPWLR